MVVSHEGYAIPLHVCDGLFYMDMWADSDDNLEHFAHIFLTADPPWNPSIVVDKFFHDPTESLGDIPDISEWHEGFDPHLDAFGTMHSLSLTHSKPPLPRPAMKL